MPLRADDIGMAPAEFERIASVLRAPAQGDLLDPPAWLWDRIAAEVAHEPVSAQAGAGTVVEYRIDRNDVVVTVGEDWERFAADNSAPDLGELPAGRTLWSYFDHDDVRTVWQLLVSRVRSQQAEASVPLRCDAPDLRRWFELTVTPEADGAVRFRCVLVFEEPRPAVALLADEVQRDVAVPAVPVCSWCGDAHDGASWAPVEVVVRNLRLLEDRLPAIDHGICPSCRSSMTAELAVTAPASRSAG